MMVDREEKAKKRRQGSGAVADINVTPMVDVMLVMLIIFMVITPMLSKGRTVELVKTKNPIPMQAADKSDAIVIAVERVVDVVDNLGAAGVDNVGLLTELQQDKMAAGSGGTTPAAAPTPGQ